MLLPIMVFNHIGIGMKISDIVRIRKEIKKINETFTDIEVLLGIEANLISLTGEIDIPEKILSEFDIILMGFHKAVKPASLRDAWNLFIKKWLGQAGAGKQ